MKDNNLFLDLASRSAEDFIKKILKIMKKETILAVRTNFSGAIFVKGAERLFSELKKRYKITERLINYLKALCKAPISELLKDNLPVDDWKSRLNNATETEEVEIVKEIVKIVGSYPGWRDKKKIDYTTKYALAKEELSCMARSILLGRMLKEIGVREERVCSAAFPMHVFLIMKLKSGSYLDIETTEDAFESTRLLGGAIAKELDKAFEKIKLLGSVRAELKEPLWPFMPGSKVIIISNITEGFLADSDFNLSVNFDMYIQQNPNLAEKEKIKIFKMELILLKEAERLDKNDSVIYANQGAVLKELAMIEKDKNLKKAIKLLDQAIEKTKKAHGLNPQYDTAKDNLKLFNKEKELLENLLREESISDFDIKAPRRYL